MTGQAPAAGRDLLDRVLALEEPSFALLYRPESGTPGVVDVLVGDVTRPASLAQVPLPTGPRDATGAVHDVLVVVPYRQLAERGFAAPDDGAPLLALSVSEQSRLPLPELMHRIPDSPITLSGQHFDVSDEEYAETVRRVVSDEIGTGEGANFVIKRTLLADIGGYTPHAALSLFRRLIEREQSAYWTFVISVGGRTFVGATPERHISVNDGTAVMNPISGTYRYPPGGPTLRGITEFLEDRKETDELYMVLDEELKMMSRICEAGGRVLGPYLKEMAQLAHTEYFIEGRTRRDVREILHETLFAPTVTGSPLESAARVIDRYEPQGRRYYSGIAALIGRDASGERALDSAILIRTADIDEAGRVRIAVGATLVRHSDPVSEAAETRAKAAVLLSALEAGGKRSFGAHPEVRAALRRRNAGIADFWLKERGTDRLAVAGLTGLKVLIVDAEDTFTAMIVQQLGAIGLAADVRRFDEPYAFDGVDLVVMGPGPGDPRAAGDPKIAAMNAALDTLIAGRVPFLAVCLSHQLLSMRLGLDLMRLPQPNQGVQREISLFGTRERVGFYNTYAAVSAEDKREVPGIGLVEVSRDRDSGVVDALRGPRFASMQFHAESVLTVDGPRLIAEAVLGVLGR
ncbi:anthranilate synthase family protein [Streptomyces sp. NPDC059989]|uniref:anthranilate synthase family protein n=1 Tax=Streptomyces sp. NPDC059989 TaxID=3347026 RepID=UPI0036C61DEB